MSSSANNSPSRNGAGDEDDNGRARDPQMDKIGEAAATYFCSAQFSEILGKEIDKRAHADRAESDATYSDQRAPIQMQLSTDKGARKAAKKSNEKSGESDKKKGKSSHEEQGQEVEESRQIGALKPEALAVIVFIILGF